VRRVRRAESVRVPLLDLKGQLEAIAPEIREAVADVIESTCYILGPKVEQLEQEVAAYVGAGHAIGVSSGTDALLVSLMALGVGPGDAVMTTGYSFFATAGTIARLQAKPIFVDIHPETYNIDPDGVRRRLEGAGRREREKVRAIIPVHLYGQSADMDPLVDVSRDLGIPIIEDAAQAIGTKYPSKTGVKNAGTMGDLGCFSFFPSKNLGGIGDGGMVVTNDERLAETVRALRNHGANARGDYPLIGGNFRLDAIQAAVLSVKLRHLDRWHAARQANAQYYDEHLQVPEVTTPKMAYRREFHIYHQYVVSVARDRDQLREFLGRREIGSAVYYPVPLHLQECFRHLGYREGDLPQSERAARQTLALPVYPELSREMQDCVIQTIRAFYR
jgi:dTDP-4-amino-4,6-dideoxygalactose transaminase